MEEIFHFRCYSGLGSHTKPYTFPCQIPQIPTVSQNAPPLPRRPLPPRGLSLSRRAPVFLPELASSIPKLPPTLPENPTPSFHEKALFLASLGIDLLAVLAEHPPVAAAPLDDIRSTVALLQSMGFTPPELCRIAGMCPEFLALTPAALVPVFTFLLREAGVAGHDLRRVIHRRPRLLVSDVAGQLRPTLYFLQTLGITAVARHTALLSCSVEEKLLPRLEFLQRVGYSHRDSRAMARRFPQLFCYSIEENLRPKLEFFVGEMGREPEEVREFPQCFSFSLRNRIRPRHRACQEKGVRLPLPALLRPSDERFRVRLEFYIKAEVYSASWHTSVRGRCGVVLVI